jgi:pilus assembly protein CpaE
MVENSRLIKLSVKDASLQARIENVIGSTRGLLLQQKDAAIPSDLLIVELSQDIERQFQVIQSLLGAAAVREVFVISEAAQPQVLLQAIKVGIKEFLPLPLDEQELRRAFENFLARHNGQTAAKAKFGDIVHVMGAKGGVGATTVAVNLAMALAKKNSSLSIALVDMNMIFGDLALFLELTPKYHWGEITKNIERLDSTFLQNVLARHPSGLHVLPSPGFLNGYPAATPEVVERLLRLMQTMFDFVIVDGGQSLNQATLRAVEMCNSLLLVSLLSLPCLANTNKVMRSFDNLSLSVKERLRLVVNRYLKKSEISVQDAEQTVHQKIFWMIPNDYKATMSAINQGKTLLEIAPKQDVTRSFCQLADKLLPVPQKPQKGSWSLFKRR